MQAARFRLIVLIGLILASYYGQLLPQSWGEGQAPNTPLTLADVTTGKAKIVDLTHALSSENPYWPGDNAIRFELKTIATIEKNGGLSKPFTMQEHYGTHIDAPNHFETKQSSVAQIRTEDLFAEGVVIDITPQASQNPDYLLTLDDLKNWESDHGRIPDQAIVLLNTGWGKFWTNYPRFKNQDAQGKMHFPAYSVEAAKWLVSERKIRALGIDNLSIDYGLSRDFMVHHVVNGAGKYALENVAHLDQLPPRGFYVMVAPIKIEEGSGGPVRIFAILPADTRGTPPIGRGE